MRAVAAVAPALFLVVFAALALPRSAEAATPAPCTITWDGQGGDNSWHTAANWSEDRLPGESDHVCVNFAFPDFTIVYSKPTTATVRSLRSFERIALSAGVIQMTDSEQASSLGDFTLSGGTFDVVAELVVNGHGVWSSGGFRGTTRILPWAAVDVVGPNTIGWHARTFSPLLINEGTLHWMGGGYLGEHSVPAVLENRGRFVVEGDGDPDPGFISGSSVAAVVNNTGTVRLDDENGVLFLQGIRNDGLVEIVAGELQLAREGTSDTPTGGTFDIDEGAVVHFLWRSHHALGEGVVFRGGGTVRISDWLDVLGDVRVSDATTIEIEMGGALRIGGDHAIHPASTSSGQVVNRGLIEAGAETGETAEIGIPVENERDANIWSSSGTVKFGDLVNRGSLTVSGHMTIAGDYRQFPGAWCTFVVFGETGSHGRVVVAGRASLAGYAGVFVSDTPIVDADVLTYASREGEFEFVGAWPLDAGMYFPRYGATTTSFHFLPAWDMTRPTNPAIRSETHRIGVSSSTQSIGMSWTGALDAQSEVDGFSYEWSHSSTTVPDTTKDAEHDATGTKSPPLADGVWYFHLRTRDNAGNWSHPIAAGPFRIDTMPPDTRIVAAPHQRTKSVTATFRFRSTEPGSTFQCKRDRRPWFACSSPKVYGALWKGLHRFRVRARDVAGNVDPTPAVRIWRIT